MADDICGLPGCGCDKFPRLLARTVSYSPRSANTETVDACICVPDGMQELGVALFWVAVGGLAGLERSKYQPEKTGKGSFVQSEKKTLLGSPKCIPTNPACLSYMLQEYLYMVRFEITTG